MTMALLPVPERNGACGCADHSAGLVLVHMSLTNVANYPIDMKNDMTPPQGQALRVTCTFGSAFSDRLHVEGKGEATNDVFFTREEEGSSPSSAAVRWRVRTAGNLTKTRGKPSEHKMLTLLP
eukprot:6354674-Prymnesium_polylepis.1